MPDLSEAPPPFSGKIDGDDSNRMSMLCIGESSVAGVGITSHEQGFVGFIAHYINKLSGLTIEWTVIAKSGVTAKRTALELVPLIDQSDYDLVIIGLGGNDTFQLNSPAKWCHDLNNLTKSILHKLPDARIVIANMPPVAHFPAFPFMIRKVFGGLIKLHGIMASKLARKHPQVFYIKHAIRLDLWLKELDDGTTIHGLFTDGVHPSSLTFSIWCKEIAEYIVSNKLHLANSELN